MLKLLLDEHVSPVIANRAEAKQRSIKIIAFQQWREGDLMGAHDRVILEEARKEGLTLVTYDQRTIRPLLKAWGEQGVDHAGVVFVDAKTIPPQDFGRLAEALCALWDSECRAEWTNRVVFLRKPA